MKICFLAAANSIHSYLWIDYFSKKGYEIHWISLVPNNFGNIKNVKFYLMGNFSIKPLNIIFNTNPIRRLIKEINPDILHVHYAGVNGVLGGLSGFHPFLLTTYGSDILLNSKSKIKRYLIKHILEKADLITCNGKTLADELIKLGVDPQKIRFVYWATDTKKFIPVLKDEELRKELGVFDSPMIISLRMLEPIYNVGTLIKATPLILKEFPAAKIIIVGNGSQEKNLKRLAQELGISRNINFVGWISYDDVPKYLNSADVYVSTSLSDGDLSQSTQQAMACEIPIIITDLIVNKERIKDGKNGLIFLAKDIISLADKIILLLKDEKLRKKLGKEGRKTILDKLDYYKNMEEADKVYKELIKNYEKK